MSRPPTEMGLRALAFALALVGCGEPWMDPTRMPQRTEVIVVPVPRGPAAPRAYRPAVPAAIAREARPDVVFVELPAAALAQLEPGDRWAEVRPEVPPLVTVAGEVGAVVEPVSGWTAAVRDDWRAFIARGLPVDPLYQRARRHRLRMDADEGDDLDWVLGAARRRVVEWEARALEGTVPGALGAAAPSRLGAAHEAALREALGRHEGERVLIVIDAKHASRMERAAVRLADARVISPLAFEDALEALEDEH